MKTKITLLMQFLLFILLFFAANTNPVNAVNNNVFEEKRVLFISSYSPSFPTFFSQIDGLKESFDGYPIILDIEFMDTKRFFTPENIERFKESISYKMSSIDYDLVITSDDNAITFVMDNKDDLFSDLPIIFFGTNNDSNAQLYAQDTDVTGVVEEVSMKETIDLALLFNPLAENIIALVDDTVTGQSELATFNDLTTTFSSYNLFTINLSQMELQDFLSEVEEVDETSVLLLISALKDVNNKPYEFDETNALILEHASQPVYHLYEYGIEGGLIGGKVVSHYVQGQTAAELVLQYFNGEVIDNLSLIEESPNVYMINYEVFGSYNFNINLLPEDTIFVNRDYTVFEEYGVYIAYAIIFVMLQAVIIFALVFSVRNRNKARLEVVATNKELEKANDQLVYKSYHDDLTGLFNRNYFEEQYPRLTRLLEDVPISIVLIDVNGLKLINDAFGHISGDKVLIETSEVLLKTFSDSDIFRIGGDEFAIIPYGKSEEGVSELIRNLNHQMSKIKIEGILLSVSVGYAFLEDGKTLREMFTEAEDWMYREKLNHVPSNRSATIDAIIETINQKDQYSQEHSRRVSELSVKIAKHMGVSDNMISEIKTAGLLHDIGKIIVPTHILNKASKLTNDEYVEIKKHSEIGYRILNSVSSMREIAQYVFCHHERIDGKGYPRGLMGKDIPIQSKIIGIADALDAMMTDRLYRGRLSKEECKKELIKYKGTQFDSEGVDAVINNFADITSVFDDL